MLRDRVGKFWVVTAPRLSSTLSDVLFQTDVQGLALQLRGGLNMDEVAGVFTDQQEAEALALLLLSGFEAAREPEDPHDAEGHASREISADTTCPICLEVLAEEKAEASR